MVPTGALTKKGVLSHTFGEITYIPTDTGGAGRCGAKVLLYVKGNRITCKASTPP